MPLSKTLANCQNPGSDMTIYWNAGTAGSPIWVEHKGIVGDVNLGIVDDEDETTRRDSASVFKEYAPGKTDISITGTQIPDGNYEGNAAFNSAIRGGDPIDILALTGPKSEEYAYGVRGEFYNFDRSITGPNTGQMEQSFNLKPALCPTTRVRYVQIVSGLVATKDWTAFTPVSTA